MVRLTQNGDNIADVERAIEPMIAALASSRLATH